LTLVLKGGKRRGRCLQVELWQVTNGPATCWRLDYKEVGISYGHLASVPTDAEWH